MDKKLAIAIFYSGCITMFSFWQKNSLVDIENKLKELEVLMDDMSKDKGLHCTPTFIEKDLWSCGEDTYKVINFTQNEGVGTDRFLGPYLAPSKSLEEWGCRYDYSIPNSGIRCYRERIVTQLKGVLVFYSFNLIKVE